MPIVGQPTDNTNNMAILCNATKFPLQCHIAGPDETHVPDEKLKDINLLARSFLVLPRGEGQGREK
jgi:hypothetical protein